MPPPHTLVPLLQLTFPAKFQSFRGRDAGMYNAEMLPREAVECLHPFHVPVLFIPI